jgi:four helix bundle protein
MPTRDFRRLDVWQKAHSLTLAVYRVSAKLPAQETYGLISQLRRSVASIAANIAEGCGRDTSADFARFLQIAMGSASELEYHLLLAKDLGFVDSRDFEELETEAIRVKKMLSSFLSRLRAESRQPKADARQPKADTGVV